jgi:RNA polymerase sigma factor (sigma-70 family)
VAALVARPPLSAVVAQTVAIAPHDDTSDDFVAVYMQHYPRLVRALQLSGSERAWAEDVAQEAFARTLGHWRRVRQGSNPPGYVYRTAFRLARRRRPEQALTGDEQSLPGVEGEAISNVTVRGALAAMPERRRACAMLCFIAGLTPKEAGEALGIAAGTVRKQLELARAELQVQLDR